MTGSGSARKTSRAKNNYKYDRPNCRIIVQELRARVSCSVCHTGSSSQRLQSFSTAVHFYHIFPMSAASPSASSNSGWDSSSSSDADPLAAPSARSDTARNLLVFAADKAGMQVMCRTPPASLVLVTRHQGVDRAHINRVIEEASRGSACVFSACYRFHCALAAVP
jgi:hypothetical protein